MAKRKARATKAKAQPQELIVPNPTEAIVQVKQWIIEGQQAADIHQAAAAAYPTLNAETLIGTALEELGADAADIDTHAARGFLLNAYREIYRRTLDIGDFGNALSALRAFERQIGT